MKKLILLVVVLGLSWLAWSWYQGRGILSLPQLSHLGEKEQTVAQEKKTRIYTWKDAAGVTHFESEPGKKGKEVVVDTGRIMSLKEYDQRNNPPPSSTSEAAADNWRSARQAVNEHVVNPVSQYVNSLHGAEEKAKAAAQLESQIPPEQKQELDAN